jgi:hypothetical protein
MAMTYELWETATGNIVGGFGSEAAALAIVRKSVHAHGSHYAGTWALLAEDDGENVEMIAEGTELIERAEWHPAA